MSAAVTIGNFDGVHRGHAALVEAARRVAGKGSNVVALCFEPHPLTVLRPDAAPARLTTFQQRREHLFRLGADEVEPLRPTKEFLAQPPDRFIQWLVEKHQPVAIVEGPDFRFGRGRAGSIETLRRLGSTHGFETIVVDPVEIALADQTIVHASSSIVRWLIDRGRVRDARYVLGRPYELRAAVVKGDQRGRSIGVPTANLDQTDVLLPADGIYAGLATAPDGSIHPAAISVGTKPTFGEYPRTCEAHLVDYDGPSDEYGWIIRVEFHDWLRDQLAFSEPEPLVAQIRRDIALTRGVRRVGPATAAEDCVSATRGRVPRTG